MNCFETQQPDWPFVGGSCYIPVQRCSWWFWTFLSARSSNRICWRNPAFASELFWWNMFFLPGSKSKKGFFTWIYSNDRRKPSIVWDKAFNLGINSLTWIEGCTSHRFEITNPRLCYAGPKEGTVITWHRDAGERGHCTPAFSKGATGAEVHFHNSIIGHFMVYQDRLETFYCSYSHTQNISFFTSFHCPQLFTAPPTAALPLFPASLT